MSVASDLATPYYDTLITDWGRTCRLIFQSGKNECPNCLIDPDTLRSAGIYQSGGPTSFTSGECPVCLGEGLVGSYSTQDIKLNVQADPQKWNTSLPKFVDMAKQPVLTWGFMTDLPAVLKSRRIVMLTDISGYNNWEYTMAGEPFDGNRIVQGRYWSSWWERVGGS